MRRNRLYIGGMLIFFGILLLWGCSEPFGGYSAGDSVSHTANSVSFVMNYVPSGGTFTMGEDVVSPTQDVTLTKNFWMGETEVTQGLWEDVMGTSWPGTDPDGSGLGAGADYPAYYVRWYDAVAFCNALTIAEEGGNKNCVYYSDSGYSNVYTSGNTVYTDFSKTGYRLPTEAEWEYAARWIDGSSWNGGDHVSGDTSAQSGYSTEMLNYAWCFINNGSSGDPDYGSKEVGTKRPNALGLYDMSGNVYEWCYDCYGTYSGTSVTDPIGPDGNSGDFRDVRGGYWGGSHQLLRCSYRSSGDPGYQDDASCIGFRLCRTAN